MPFLTQGKTNWRYIIIVLILAVIVGGGILGCLRYFERETESLTKLPEVKKLEKEAKKEFGEADKILIFKEIFPDGVTNTDLDKVSDIGERAVLYFQTDFRPPGEWQTMARGRYRYVELDGDLDAELLVQHTFWKLEFPGLISDYTLYVFDWDGKEWKLRGKIRSIVDYFKVEEVKTRALWDIIIKKSTARGYDYTKYKWNGMNYIEEEYVYCDHVHPELNSPRCSEYESKTYEEF